MPRRSQLARIILAALPVLGPIACASGNATPGVAQAGRSSDVITETELSDPALMGKTLLEAIQRLRPRFLDSRSSSVREGASPVMVSLDGALPQNATELARTSVAEVSEVRFLNLGEATMRFGMNGVSGPVILITRKH